MFLVGTRGFEPPTSRFPKINPHLALKRIKLTASSPYCVLDHLSSHQLFLKISVSCRRRFYLFVIVPESSTHFLNGSSPYHSRRSVNSVCSVSSDLDCRSDVDSHFPQERDLRRRN